MAIIRFFEVTGSRSGSINDSFEREYDRKYIAESNSIHDDEPEIYAHRDCPRLWKPAPFDNLSKCDKLQAKLRPKTGNGRWRWDVTAHFSSIQFSDQKRDDPTEDPAETEIDTELCSEESYFDADGKPFLNTAGDLIKTTIEIPRAEIQVQKNIPLGLSWLIEIEGCVNNSPVRIHGVLWDTGTLKVTKVKIGKVEWRNKIPFMVCRVTIRHRREGWETTALNVGYYELRADPTGKIKDKSGRPAIVRWRCLTGGIEGEPESQPVFLNKEGRRPQMHVFENGIPKLRPKCPLDPKDIIVLKQQKLRLVDFKQFPLA